ncbi:restriction endonuclease subunit S [Streptomyces sp. NPDC001406]|uniref:restriction endonuclease subunit S n=1 Tax=Streptomyces sp. NPDC001406 TaxID=3364572 RepID=UPI0036C8B92C
MSEWTFVSYESLASADKSSFSMGPFGSKITKENYVSDGIPVIRGVNLARGIFMDDDFVFVTAEKADEILSANVNPGDLIFTHRGTIGQVSMVPRKPRFSRYVIGSSQVKTRLDEKKAVPEFYYYWFQSPEGQHSILAHASTVGVPGIATPLTSIRNLRVPYPTLSEQRALVEVLGALDDKIAINERIATTADELLRALYREACNSASESITIGELGRLIRDGVPASSLTGGEHYIGLEHMPRRNMWLSVWEDDAELASGKSAFCSNDVLFGKLRPYFHKVGLALTSGVCSTDILVVRPVVSGRLGWLLLALSSDEVVAHASAVGDGTRMPRAKWKDLESLVVPWPGHAEATRLNEIVRSLAARVQASVTESRTLASLRDTLLPQLMSGRLRVKDAEKIVEDAT